MITKILIKGPSPTHPPSHKVVYRPNQRVNFSDIRIKKETLRGALPGSTAGGRVLEGTQPAPLLVLTRGRGREHITKTTGRAFDTAHKSTKFISGLDRALSHPQPSAKQGALEKI